MSEFDDMVFAMVARIPRGCVAAYGDIARYIGRPRAPRIVGCALHGAPGPDKLPCHRVVFKDGSLCEGYVFGGPGEQRRRLEAEGVAFTPDGRVDMAACRWQPHGLLDAQGRPADIDWLRELGD